MSYVHFTPAKFSIYPNADSHLPTRLYSLSQLIYCACILPYLAIIIRILTLNQFGIEIGIETCIAINKAISLCYRIKANLGCIFDVFKEDFYAYSCQITQSTNEQTDL